MFPSFPREEDELVRQITKVDLVVNGKSLQNNNTNLDEAGISAASAVQVLYTIDSVECSRKEDSCCHAQDLLAVVIPSHVVRIDQEAFCNCNSLASVTIPDSVTRFEAGAIQNCTSLVSAKIPDSLTHIGRRAFSFCRSRSQGFLRFLQAPGKPSQLRQVN